MGKELSISEQVEKITASTTSVRLAQGKKVATITGVNRNDADLNKILQNAKNKALTKSAWSYSAYFGGTAVATTSIASHTLDSNEALSETRIITEVEVFILGEVNAAGFPVDADGKVLQNAQVEITMGNQTQIIPVPTCLNVLTPVADGSTGLEATPGITRAFRATLEEPIAVMAQGDTISVKVTGCNEITCSAAHGFSVTLGGYRYSAIS